MEWGRGEAESGEGKAETKADLCAGSAAAAVAAKADSRHLWGHRARSQVARERGEGQEGQKERGDGHAEEEEEEGGQGVIGGKRGRRGSGNMTI